MTPQDALDDLRDNCDHGVEPDCWYCEIAAVITDQQSKLDLYKKACASAVEAVAIMEGTGVAYCMRSIGKPAEETALFDDLTGDSSA